MFEDRKLRSIITAALFLTIQLWVQAAQGEVVVITHPSNSNASIGKADFSRIFLGRVKSFPDGSKAVPINQVAGNSTRIAFDKEHLGKSASQIKAYWSRQLFTGRGVPPQEVSEDADVIKSVSANRNMIGYVDSSAVNDSVRVVSIVN